MDKYFLCKLELAKYGILAQGNVSKLSLVILIKLLILILIEQEPRWLHQVQMEQQEYITLIHQNVQLYYKVSNIIFRALRSSK